MTRPLVWKRLSAPRPGAGAILLGLMAAAVAALWVLDGALRPRAWPLAAGTLFGVAAQRGELSLVRAWRDLIVLRDGGQLLGFAAALAVATTLTLAGVMIEGAAFVPPGARIGPVSWMLPVAAFAFGVGAVIARGSLMVHLRRVGEGSMVAVPALVGTFGGFVIALALWPWVFAHALDDAPWLWLPTSLGLKNTLIVECGAFAIAAAVLLNFRAPPESGRRGLVERIAVTPWPAWTTACLVGVLIAASYAAGEPLGLTTECAAVARAVGHALGIVAERLPGLDTGIGGVTIGTPAFGGEATVVVGVVAGSLAAAVSSGRFAIAGMTLREAAEMVGGGILIGLGGMFALGTITGTMISGIAIGAVSGWVFLAFASLGIIVALKLDRRPAMTGPEPGLRLGQTEVRASRRPQKRAPQHEDGSGSHKRSSC